jgi:hypothetical protein
MKFAPRNNRRAYAVFRVAATLFTVAVLPFLLSAAAPSWWSGRGVLTDNTAPDDYAPANQGQLKNIARAAAAEMDAKLSGGAGDEVHELVSSWLVPNPVTNDFAPINQGQVKAVAKPFYDRLISSGIARYYPWDVSQAPTDDFAVANIGQIKNLFSFEIPPANELNHPSRDRLAAGEYSANLALEPYAVWIWGDRLTSGNGFALNYPHPLSGLGPASSVSAGEHHLVVLHNDGTVSTWGENDAGQLGDSTNTKREIPGPVPGLTNIATVKAGGFHTLALKNDGTVLAWGANDYGQLGTGDTTAVATPALVTGLDNVQKIGASYQRSVALKNDGTVWSWGYDHYAWQTDQELFDPAPVLVTALTEIVDVTVGYEHTVAVKADGTVWAWGSNYSNQIGDGSPSWEFVAAPVQVPGLSNIIKVASTYDHTLALASDGTVWAWGENSFAQLGDGTNQLRRTPVHVTGLTDVIAIAAAYSYSLAMKTDGSIWMWGNGAVGIAPDVDKRVPQLVGPVLIDTNHNGTDDRWELQYFGNLNQTSNADFDGDGFSNLNEYLRGTDPTDYFNGSTPVLEVAGGNNQVGDAGTFLPKPFVVRVRDSAGQLLVGAPVTFAVKAGSGALAPILGAAREQNLVVRTDAKGQAFAYHVLPQTAGASSRTIVSAGKSDASTPLTFRAIAKAVLPPTPTPAPPPPGTTPTATPSPTPLLRAPYRYAIIDLGKNFSGYKIANNGWVLLDSYSNQDPGHYRWRNGILERLTTTEATNVTDFNTMDMNDAGVVVGYVAPPTSWRVDAENETRAGLRWEPNQSLAVKVPGPLAVSTTDGHSNQRGTVREASFTAINNHNEIYGWVRTGNVTSFLLGVIPILNAYIWPENLGLPVQVSFASAVNDASNNYTSFWQGSSDTITHANSSRRYIGQKFTPFPTIIGNLSGTTTGMIDGQSVSFQPEDLNESGLIVGNTRDNKFAVIRTPVPAPSPPAGASGTFTETMLPGVSVVAVNDHTRPNRSVQGQPSPGPSPGASPTPIAAPQIIAYIGNVPALLERDEDGRTWHAFGLEEMIPTMEGWEFLQPSDINDNGMIVGNAWYTDPSNPRAERENHAFLLAPVELMVDGNRDGEMSFDDPIIHADDVTTEDKPYRFWLNNDHDDFHTVDGDDSEYDDINDGSKDCDYTTIATMRDLEDFSRLRINLKGVTDLIKDPQTTASLEWRSISGDKIVPASDGVPEIIVYQERESSVRPLYLEDEAAALHQRDTPFDTWIGGVRAGQFMDLFRLRPTLRNSLSEQNPYLNLLFCGKTAGRGQLILVAKKGSSVVFESSPVYIELLDIKDMYERWTVGDEPTSGPEVLAQLAQRSVPNGYAATNHGRPFAYKPDDPEDPKYVLYVHGWNMLPSDKDQFAETAYKRMFWQGFKGRFGAFQWPTTYGFGALLSDDTRWKNGVNGIYSATTDPTNYDRGEWNAWQSAIALKRLLIRISHDYPGQTFMFAHSMGNVVAGEALRLAGVEGRTSLINTYVATQAAVPVHCYAGGQKAPLDAQVPAEWLLRMFDGGYPQTPNVYLDWFASTASSATRLINFYNINDYALWTDVWQLNQYFKPDRLDPGKQPWTYRYAGDFAAIPVQDEFRKDYFDPRDPAHDLQLRLGDSIDVRDRYEIMAFAAESRSKALGATNNVSTLTDNVNLQTIWPADVESPARPYASHKWHSAEFRSTNMRQQGYWKTLLGERGFNIIMAQP